MAEPSEDYLSGYAQGVADSSKAYQEGYQVGYSDAKNGIEYTED